MSMSAAVSSFFGVASLSKPYYPTTRISCLPVSLSKLLMNTTFSNGVRAVSTVADLTAEDGKIGGFERPDSFGRFGKFGGKYVPETLMEALSELETAFYSLAKDHDFQVGWRNQSYFLRGVFYVYLEFFMWDLLCFVKLFFPFGFF